MPHSSDGIKSSSIPEGTVRGIERLERQRDSAIERHPATKNETNPGSNGSAVDEFSLNAMIYGNSGEQNMYIGQSRGSQGNFYFNKDQNRPIQAPCSIHQSLSSPHFVHQYLSPRQRNQQPAMSLSTPKNNQLFPVHTQSKLGYLHGYPTASNGNLQDADHFHTFSSQYLHNNVPQTQALHAPDDLYADRSYSAPKQFKETDFALMEMHLAELEPPRKPGARRLKRPDPNVVRMLFAVVQAIQGIKKRKSLKGCSLQALKKYIRQQYGIDFDQPDEKKRVVKACRLGMRRGILKQDKHSYLLAKPPKNPLIAGRTQLAHDVHHGGRGSTAYETPEFPFSPTFFPKDAAEAGISKMSFLGGGVQARPSNMFMIPSHALSYPVSQHGQSTNSGGHWLSNGATGSPMHQQANQIFNGVRGGSSPTGQQYWNFSGSSNISTAVGPSYQAPSYTNHVNSSMSTEQIHDERTGRRPNQDEVECPGNS